ncbi:transcription initiation factor TFIID subunit 9B [Nematocida parisii]|uniref:Transcription initiation factor n=1 Tax=Nematocida parisii (strain ERTm3) TaxID=935791 RepID=I3EJQ5_NEMP3|nr:transcription initiation factor [Nematocida parisii ERTm1]EIJ89452.1 transcription initiation factor [Nematocida parisii ERTm3]KAI5131296.1 transcription initiation factor TFIID subunit 9B [Nematocida parisii]KAI5168001.1 transcription initiation factor TFIID subunit 9B [Nematocida sp. AWRm79]KAI5186647.1 transcription initiation factor TFIID subunit 9B [Nematocida sp. AWRm78]OAG32120.1 transcription initiation factor TFIID subunit 9B [Nematocida sp. ERTm5]|eukprot:XP_013058848.1 transcription initiation factor [Nematocida parisii ERTm1]
MGSSDSLAPRDAKIISLILRSVGIEECEPKVILQFLEVAYKYFIEALEDAMLYAEHAGRTTPNGADIKLAIQTKVGKYFVPPPPRQFMLEISSRINSKPLTVLETSNLIRIPGEKTSLLELYYATIRKDETRKRKK